MVNSPQRRGRDGYTNILEARRKAIETQDHGPDTLFFGAAVSFIKLDLLSGGCISVTLEITPTPKSPRPSSQRGALLIRKLAEVVDQLPDLFVGQAGEGVHAGMG